MTATMHRSAEISAVDHPRRVQRRRTKGWRLPEGAICVDRSSGFGSPFPITKAKSLSRGITKDSWCVGTWNGPGMWFVDTEEEARVLSVKAYEAWIKKPAQQILREKVRLLLRGHDLACWCELDEPCHADVLLEVANAL